MYGGTQSRQAANSKLTANEKTAPNRGILTGGDDTHLCNHAAGAAQFQLEPSPPMDQCAHQRGARPPVHHRRRSVTELGKTALNWSESGLVSQYCAGRPGADRSPDALDQNRTGRKQRMRKTAENRTNQARIATTRQNLPCQTRYLIN